MKKSLLLLSSILTAGGLMAQEPADALRFSWNVHGGTARVQAVGGAMGSLGGDITASFINPAGLGFYRTGDFVLTPMYAFGKTKANYLDTETSDKNNKFTWGTSGIVFGTGHGSGKIRSSAISLAFSRMADFNSQYTYRGVNTQSSYSQKFLEEIGNIGDGNTVAGEFPYGTSQAFNTGWIDTVGGSTNGNFRFQSFSQPLVASGLGQQQTVRTWGGINEFTLAGGANLKDKLLFGAAVGIPIMNYQRRNEFVEADMTENPNNNFEDAVINENFSTRGLGVNLKLGVIYKPQEFWRLGFAFHSPTVYSLTDRNNVTIAVNTEGRNGYQYQGTEDVTGGPAEFKYLYVSPYRLIGSVSYVLREIEDVTKQRGFITADIEYINHSASSYSIDEDYAETDASDEAYLKSLNTAIDNAYKGAFNFRAGAELKFTTIMVRAGAAYYGNPYKKIKDEEGSRTTFSGGLGYRNKGFFIDLTYIHSLNKDVHYAYRLQNGAYSGARLNNTNGQIVATVGIKL